MSERVTRPVIAAVVCAIALSSCSRGPHHDPAPEDPAPLSSLDRLRAFETARRAETSFVELASQEKAFGSDPYDLALLPDKQHVAGILRGRDAIVLMDEAAGVTLASAPTPPSPSAITVYRGKPSGPLLPGDLLVTSELAPVIAHYRVTAAAPIERLADIDLANVMGARDVATGPGGEVYVVEEHDDRLVTLRFGSPGSALVARSEVRMPRGPIRVVRRRDALVVMSLLDHRLSILDPSSGKLAASSQIDGPYWGFAVSEDDGASRDLTILAGGAEDHPLDRTGGFFGYVDSFVYVHRYNHATRSLEKVAALDVAEHGLIVPKAIAFDDGGAALVTSYGGAKALRLSWSSTEASPKVEAVDAIPGASALIATPHGFVAANPLVDAWVSLDPGGRVVSVRHVEGEADHRTDHERLGEALFFTSLMAPASSSQGPKSRFTCETCHFEGYVDGRVHHTGRGDVHAATKPLVGLFNNRPHFSRALDPDLASVAENEFRVAGAPSPADPHFDLDTKDVPWLAELSLEKPHYDATELRVSLMAFLMTWTHRHNPRSFGRGDRRFTPEEREGAIAFRDRCERCHEARTSADVPSSRVPFDRWEALVFAAGGGAIVWASDAYEKTGIEPYVHERGARVPSLRRVYKKRPYFTNGSAPDIASVLRRSRIDPESGAFLHDAPSSADLPARKLDDKTARALAAFIDLL